MKSILRIALGLFLLMIGIIGLFIPLLQGVLIILIAIPILSPKHGKLIVEKIKQLRDAFSRRYPNR